MVNIYRRLCLSEKWVYNIPDVIMIFKRFHDNGFLDFDDISDSLVPCNSQNVLDPWVISGNQDLVALAYMAANNILPMLTHIDRLDCPDLLQETIRIFILKPFRALGDNSTREFLKSMAKIRDKITSKDSIYTDKCMKPLEIQIEYLFDRYNFRGIGFD